MDKRKILIIDDDESYCLVIKTRLESTGHFEVRTATDGKSGLMLSKGFKPDLVLLDVLMPEMSGSEVASRLQHDPATRNIPIIFLTGVASKEDVDSHNGVIGGFPFLAKPVETEELINAIGLNLGMEI